MSIFTSSRDKSSRRSRRIRITRCHSVNVFHMFFDRAHIRMHFSNQIVLSARKLLNVRSEEHTSELQSQFHLVCRLLLEKKKNNRQDTPRQKKKKNSRNTFGTKNKT